METVALKQESKKSAQKKWWQEKREKKKAKRQRDEKASTDPTADADADSIGSASVAAAEESAASTSASKKKRKTADDSGAAAAGGGETASDDTGREKKNKKKSKNKSMSKHASGTGGDGGAGIDGGGGGSSGGDGGGVDSNSLEIYAVKQSEPEPEVLTTLRAEIRQAMPNANHMTSGPLQGRLLKSFASIKGATRILEIGTFCGYSALSLAEGLGDGGTLVTLEIDPEAAAIATKHFALSPHGKKITLMVGPGMETLAKLAKKNPGGPFDLVFLDADKRSYRAYYDLLLSSDLLQKSALILADNVLFKGKVLNSAARAAGGQTKELNYWQRRHQDIADDLHDFNVYVNKDPRTEAVLLPLRDGLTVIRRV